MRRRKEKMYLNNSGSYHGPFWKGIPQLYVKLYISYMAYKAPERCERWESVPSKFEILTATLGQPAEIASEISGQQPKEVTRNRGCQPNWSKSPKR